MKQNQTYRLLRLKMQSLSTVAPQSFGVLTPIYKIVIPYFKSMPWVTIGFLCTLLVFFLYFVFGQMLVRLASILQFGF